MKNIALNTSFLILFILGKKAVAMFAMFISGAATNKLKMTFTDIQRNGNKVICHFLSFFFTALLFPFFGFFPLFVFSFSLSLFFSIKYLLLLIDGSKYHNASNDISLILI